MDQLRFAVENKALIFNIEIIEGYSKSSKKMFWCTLIFEENNKQLVLGSDILSNVLSNFLISFFSFRKQNFFEYKGISVFHIMNLMEPHSNLVVSIINENEDFLFHVIDSEGNLIPLLKFDINMKQRFVTEITKFIER